MGHVFISYSRSDRAYVEKLFDHLQMAGLDVWFDREITSGRRWNAVVERKIRTCGAMIVVMSAAASSSTMVENEVDLAQSLGKLLVPLLLDGVEPIFGLRHLQYVDVRGGVLPDPDFVRSLLAPSPQPPQTTKPEQWSPPAVSTLITAIAGQRSMTCSIDGSVFVTVDGSTAFVFDGKTGDLRRSIFVSTKNGPVRSVVDGVGLSPNGGRMATMQFGKVQVWDTTNGARLWTASVGAHATHAAFVGDDSRMLVIYSGLGIADLWEIGKKRPKLRLPWRVSSISHSADWSHFATFDDGGGGFGNVLVWDAATLSVRHAIHGIPVGTIYSTDLTLLACAVVDGSIQLWDVATTTTWRLIGHTEQVQALAFFPNNAGLVSISPDSIRVWDVSSASVRHTIPRDRALSILIGCSPGSGQVVVARRGQPGQGDIQFWDVATGTLRHTIVTVAHQLTYSPDGTRMITLNEDDFTVRLWRIAEAAQNGRARDE